MGKRFLCVWLVLLLGTAAAAKDKPLVAIVLYHTGSGPAYVQLSDFSINATRGLMVCTGQPLDNNAYKRLAKTALAAGMVLERNASGALVITSAASAAATCVVPAGLKLEKSRTYSLKELADLGTIGGAPVGTSSNVGAALPTKLQVGMEIRLVEAPDTELAEYLRAARAQSIALWSEYLKQYPTAAHAAEARQSLAALVLNLGNRQMAAYKKSVADGAPALDQLKNARLSAGQALKLLPGSSGAEKLRLEVEAELQTVLSSGRAELNAYAAALNQRTAGYEHLGRAQKQVENVLAVNPSYAAADKLQADIYAQQQALEAALATAESQVREAKFDQAYATIVRFQSFSGEVPRIAAVVEAAFKFRRNRGRQAEADRNWQQAAAEYRRALEYRSDAETAEALKRAETELKNVRDAAVARKAIEDARGFAQAKQFVEAYQLLEKLPQEQRQLVASEMDKLRADYRIDLVRRGNALLKMHVPIRGRADEDGVRRTYDFLERASRLAEDEPTKVKLDLLGDRISAYYLQSAKRALEKPRGSGVALGWLLLKEAERYSPDNDETRNQLAKYQPEFENHGKLSVAVRFRDQTSRRDSLGFADQLADTVMTGLENSGLPGVKPVSLQQRAGADMEADPTAPFVANFHITGNIVQHRVDKKTETQALTSHYRAGHREVKNPAWIELRRNLDALQKDYDAAKDEYNLTQARSGKNKKLLAGAQAKVDDLGKKVEEAKSKLDEVSETVVQTVIEPYNYLRRTVQLTAVAEVSFRLTDPNASTSLLTDSVKVEVPKTAVILENVKPEDSDGIVEEGTPPDEYQLLTQAEEQLKHNLVQKLVQGLREVPAKILEQARTAAARGDLESAAEKYVVYLNSTEAKETKERIEAQQFLLKQYNISTIRVVR